MIKKIFSNVILSIFMNKSAKKNFFILQKNRKVKNNSTNMLSTLGSKKPSMIIAEAKVHVPHLGRQELIRNALEAHEKNANVLDNLSEDQKHKLQQLAMKTMLGKTIRSNKEQNKFKDKLPTADAKAPAERSARTRTHNIKRQTLIENAIAAHKKYSKVLDDLSEDQRHKLQLLAMQIMFKKNE
jgi:hypothetical protein